MDVSIVIPTFNEKENVPAVFARVAGVLQAFGYSFEIVFVDDSTDETPVILKTLAERHPEARFLHREGARGLAAAVAQGFKLAAGKYIVVMDADLQHPPELLPLILKRLTTADIVIPSRFIAGGGDGGLSPFRRFVSWTARQVARLSIQRLRSISDCTSGYFGLNRTVLAGTALDPVGWKILMEVLVKGSYRSVHEIPYSFAARGRGESKMSFREQLNYLRHIARLVAASPEDRRFYLFCLVGSLGVFVNLIALKLLLTGLDLEATAASVVASLIAMTHNFLWNDNITWRGHRHPVIWRRMLQFPQFVLVCAVGVGITAVCARLFVALGGSIYLGQLAGIVTAAVWSYTANNRWTWSGAKAKAGDEQAALVVTQDQGD